MMKKIFALITVAALAAGVAAANDFYSPSGTPATGSSITSASMRSEFALIEDGFDKVSSLTGKGDLPVFVNTAASSQEAITASSARTKLGLAIGTDVQAYDADLSTYAGITPSTDVQSYLGAATYAAMRALIDLEAGTDFYSTSAADSTFEGMLVNEAGLYSALSDVSQFVEAGDSPTLLDATTWTVFYSNGSGDVTELALGASGTVLQSNGASSAPTFSAASAGLGTMVTGVPMTGTDKGLIPTNGTDVDHDIDLSKGSIMSSDNTTALKLTAAMTKRIDAVWAAATGNGGLFSGASLAANTEYHMHLIKKDSDSSIDWGFDDNITATNIPIGYTAYAWLGSVWTDSASNILPFSYVAGDNIMIFNTCSTSPVLVSGAASVSYADITASIQAVVSTSRTLVYLGGISNTANSNYLYLSRDGVSSIDYFRAIKNSSFNDADVSWSAGTNTEATADYFHDVENNDLYYKIEASYSTDLLLRAAKFIR